MILILVFFIRKVYIICFIVVMRDEINLNRIIGMSVIITFYYVDGVCIIIIIMYFKFTFISGMASC